VTGPEVVAICRGVTLAGDKLSGTAGVLGAASFPAHTGRLG
jgi:hypothetical protein